MHGDVDQRRKKLKLQRVTWGLTIVVILGLVAVAIDRGAIWAVERLGTLLTITFGLLGIAGSIVTTAALRNIQETEERLMADVLNLEDATRRSLTGFPEIFARALWLFEKAKETEEIWYVNFLYRFGLPHQHRQDLQDEFEQVATALNLKAKEFSAAISSFHALLLGMIQKTPKFRSIVLSPERIKELVIDRLKMNPDYATLDAQEVIEKEHQTYSDLAAAHAMRHVHLEEGKKIDDFAAYRADRLPLQLIIAKIPGGAREEGKWGCLVFLVGTENVGGGIPRGFYTELDHLVEIYKDFAEGLMEAADPIDL